MIPTIERPVTYLASIGRTLAFAILLSCILAIAITVRLLQLLFPDVSIGSKQLSTLRELGTINSLAIFIFVAPAIETALFQTVPLRLGLLFGDKGLSLAVVLSSLAFGFAHSYSTTYIVATSLIGLLFAIAYLAEMRRNGLPYYFVFAIHATHNAVAYFVAYRGNNWA